MKNNINWQAQRKRSHYMRTQRMEAEFRRRWGKHKTEYFDPQGRAIDMYRWGKLRNSPSRRRCTRHWRVNFTKTRHHYVSTVWLGMDHSFGMGPSPIIFESMVFCEHDDAEGKRQRNAARVMSIDPSKIAEFGEAYEPNDCTLDNYMDRYVTKAQAAKGHWHMVEYVRAYERGVRDEE